MTGEATILRVLFLCTGNSARSILAESMLRKLGAGRVTACSAGSAPTGRVNPFALDYLEANGFPVEGLRSKSWDEFAQEAAAPLDVVITVCDNAAGEACPAWPGRPVRAHWGIPDPAAVRGTDADRRRAFADVADVLLHRIRSFVTLPLESLDAPALQRELHALALARDNP